MATNRKKKTEKPKKEQAQKLAEKIGAALTDGPEAKPARKNLPKRKAKPGQVSGALSSREAERSLWAPRVSAKTPKKKK